MVLAPDRCRRRPRLIRSAHTRLAALVAALVALTVFAAASSPAAAAPVKRAVPDYDGRPDPGATAGEVLLWVPRVILSPAYFAAEYVLRRPLGWLVTEAERADVPRFLINVFTFGDSGAGIVPTFLFDFGLEAGAQPSGGVYFFWDDVTYTGHDLRLRAAFGGGDWVDLDFTNRFALSDTARLTLAFDYDRRQDQVFAGIGPSFGEGAIGRFGLDRVGGSLGVTLDLGARGGLELAFGARRYSYFRARCCEDPFIQDRIAAGVYPTPPGFDTRHAQLGPELRVAIDTRPVRPGPESGVRVELFGAYAHGLRAPDASWLRSGASVGGYLDVRNNRTLGLRLHAELASPLEGVIPVSELVPLGGDAPLRAFADGRLRGGSAVALTLAYTWPIWVFLDGDLFVELGNVFGDRFAGFASERLRLSFGLGMRPADREDHPFELLLAFGTEPLGDGAEVTTVRVVFGTTSGF